MTTHDRPVFCGMCGHEIKEYDEKAHGAYCGECIEELREEIVEAQYV